MDEALLFRDSMMMDCLAGDPVPDERLPFRDPDLSAREKELLQEVNLLRKDPPAYAELLIRRRKHFYLTADLVPADPPQRNPNLTEGKKAVLEAIDVLQKSKGVRKIKWKDGLHLASQEIRRLISGQQTTQPTSPEQVNRAIYSYGEYQGRATQLCGWGYSNPKEILCHLLISDGDATRHSREILLGQDFGYGGVALSPDERGMVVFHFITEKCASWMNWFVLLCSDFVF